MHVMVIGAAGMIGRKLSKFILSQIEHHPVTALTLVDVFTPPVPDNCPEDLMPNCLQVDITSPTSAAKLTQMQPDIVYHLAAVVSGEAEANLDKGYAANLTATWQLIEAFRTQGNCPRFVFSSSLAVYGAPFPDVVPEDFNLRPASSYGTQKAMAEMLLTDYTRRGLIDGISVRLPTVVIRPGAPNAAASGFLSSIIREPLAGKRAQLPVSKDQHVWISSPDISVQNLFHAAHIPRDALKTVTTLNLPGLTATIRDMINALITAKGEDAAALIDEIPNEAVHRIVCSWPHSFETTTAQRLGFKSDAGFGAIIHQYMAEMDML